MFEKRCVLADRFHGRLGKTSREKNLRFQTKTDTCGRTRLRYTYSFSFENATFSLRIRLPSTRILCNENRTFRQRSLELNFLKTLFSRVPVYRRERNFSKTLRTHYQVQSTPSNIRNLFKMADGRFPFLSFILGLISNLIACFQANSSS